MINIDKITVRLKNTQDLGKTTQNEIKNTQNKKNKNF